MATSMKSVAFHNLGCKVNSYELDVMMQMLQEKGYQIVPFDQYADIYIVNTCTVTNIADRKSRQMISSANFQVKSHPSAACKLGFAAMRGIPAKSVPEGQMNSQNQGCPRPATSSTHMGSTITSPTSTTYLR